MSDAGSLKLVLEHAETARDRARSELQRAETQCQAARQQLQQLEDYRAETDRRTTAQLRETGSIELLRCAQGFAARLGQAIEQQQRTLQFAEQRLEAARQRWQQAELQVASVGKLIERRVAEADQRAQRREQRQTDEQASRTLHRGGSHGSSSDGGSSTLAFAADRG